jgi:hypothetical protein
MIGCLLIANYGKTARRIMRTRTGLLQFATRLSLSGRTGAFRM